MNGAAMTPIVLIAAVLISALIYKVFVKPLSYWKDRNVPQIPSIPIFGNVAAIVFGRRSLAGTVVELVRKCSDLGYSGILVFTEPYLLVSEPRLLREIASKDHEYFADHTTVISEDVDPVFARSLAQLHGREWKEMRATLSPAFTRNKIKSMYASMTKCARRTVDGLAEKSFVDIKEVFSRYANDVIGLCAYGVDCNSTKAKSGEFFSMAKTAASEAGILNWKFFLAPFCPPAAKLFNLKICSDKTTAFFGEIIKQSLKSRDGSASDRPDMLQFLRDAQSGRYKFENDDDVKKNLSFEDILSQCLLFFFAALDSTSTALTLLALELAHNVDVQARLRREVDEVMRDGVPDFEELMQMKYLDMVVSESLRKWPTIVLTDRVCTKDCKLDPNLTIRKGERLIVPIMGIHRNGRYFPNPEKFDPERFSDENKTDIVPFSYHPFGIGSRMCIGNRFALVKMKVAVLHLLHDFEIVRTERTPEPVVPASGIDLVRKDGCFVGLKWRPGPNI